MNVKPMIAAVRSTSNKFQNLRDVAHCAKLALEQNACMLFLPECFGFLGESAIQTIEEAEEYDHYVSILKESSTSWSDCYNITRSINDEAVTKMIQETISQSTTTTTTIESYHHPSPVQTSLVEQQQHPKVMSLLDGLRTIARLSGLWISSGGIHIRTNPAGEAAATKVYNAHVIIDPNGRLQAHYHKIHLFDVDNIPGKQQQQMVTLKESDTTVPGTEYVVCPDTPLGTLGLSICYDVRFPEQYTTLRKMGANVLLVPSAFTVPTGQAGHWHVLLQARAIETQCYVIAAAQVGRHNQKRTSYGHALIDDPWGMILADAGGLDHHQEDDNNNHRSTTTPSTLSPPSIITAPINLE
jgi:deaminated glutathione amidase